MKQMIDWFWQMLVSSHGNSYIAANHMTANQQTALIGCKYIYFR